MDIPGDADLVVLTRPGEASVLSNRPPDEVVALLRNIANLVETGSLKVKPIP